MSIEIVVDTNVIVSALKSERGASNKLMQLVGSELFGLNISVALILEYEAVIKRLFPNLKKTDIDDFLDYICKVSKHNNIYYLWRPRLNDPGDDMLLELAVSAGAEYILTYNLKDFKAMTGFGITSITPKDFLYKIGELS